MTPKPEKSAGYFHNGIPYNRVGRGARPLVVFQGLLFENKPDSGFMARQYSFLGEVYTVFAALRKPGLPRGCTMKDMADDYAEMIREEFGGAVDVIGVSTGGSIAQHFAADHPDLVRKLVIHSSAYALSEPAKALQLQTARLAAERRWREANALMLGAILPHTGAMRLLGGAVIWIGSLLAGWFAAPKDPSDFIVTVEAEDQFNFKDRLGEIRAPVLVIAGSQDPFYSRSLFEETAAGIPRARLVLYEGMGHPAAGEAFNREVLAFLREE